MDLDSYLTHLSKPRALSRLSFLEDLLKNFTPGERFVLYLLTITFGASAIALLISLNTMASVRVPTYGGTFTEGEVGSVRFLNPVLTLSQPDEDLTALVYSGLTRVTPDGAIIPDLASGYEISPDGTTYTFHLRPNITFHDKKPLTAADVIFTVEAAKNPEIKSPRRADWEGVVVSSPDPLTVVYKLPRPYRPFIENTTLGILPKHIWEHVSPPEFPFNPANTHPIGSGPFRVTRADTDSTGTATRYDLSPFSKFTLGAPFLKKITFMFYPNQSAMIDAFNRGNVDAMAGVSPHDLSSLPPDAKVVHVPLPRVFGVFFNESHAPVLSDQAARAALLAAVDKKEIIRAVFGGFAAPLRGPIPPGAMGTLAPALPTSFSHTMSTSSEVSLTAPYVDAARTILTRGGWTFDPSRQVWKKKKLELSFALATADEPELVATANAVAKFWRAAGVKVTVQIYPLSELNTNIIRPRAYDAILFGEVVGRTADLFAFWHSSQRNDPGLNLSLYANSKVDALLARARATIDKKAREQMYEQFDAEIEKDVPGVFLYAPEFIYVVPEWMHGVELGSLSNPSDRFLATHKWYTDTERVWSIFTNATN